MIIEPGTTMREWEKRRTGWKNEGEMGPGDPGEIGVPGPAAPEPHYSRVLSDADLAVLRAALPIIERLVGR